MNLKIRVKRNSPESMTRQIREQINAAIDAGTLLANELVPSERELAKTAKVARNVVRGAYEQLISVGKLRSEGRKGDRSKPGEVRKRPPAPRKLPKRLLRKLLRQRKATRNNCGWALLSSGNIVSRCSHSRVLAPSRPSERISF